MFKEDGGVSQRWTHSEVAESEEATGLGGHHVTRLNESNLRITKNVWKGYLAGGVTGVARCRSLMQGW